MDALRALETLGTTGVPRTRISCGFLRRKEHCSSNDLWGRSLFSLSLRPAENAWAKESAEKRWAGHERRSTGAKARLIFNHLRPD